MLNEGTASYQSPALGMFPFIAPVLFGLQNRCTKFGDITDGTSNTLAAGETSYSFPNYNWTASSCASLAGTQRWGTARWGVGYPNIGIGDTSSVMNNFASTAPTGYSSQHMGGIQVLLADGSVRFLSQSINFTLYNAMSTKAGGEVLGEF